MRYITLNNLGDAELKDLDEYDLPTFKERIRLLKQPGEKLLDFAAKIKSANGIIQITPAYNGDYQASLKNATDVLYDEWKRKPIAISTFFAGQFAGMNVITSIEYSL